MQHRGNVRKAYKMLGSHHKGMRPPWRSKCTWKKSDIRVCTELILIRTGFSGKLL